ncbi:unnamed protein product [Pleuronectes platessa]|uniref:Uncharacterized protein n=1 Tax=Pleuronectes platessa TaxID=8262 RepID=A0A9N7TJB1_PLEPL|nr:unnamed protein product [Pleuronectes platessa]
MKNKSIICLSFQTTTGGQDRQKTPCWRTLHSKQKLQDPRTRTYGAKSRHARVAPYRRRAVPFPAPSDEVNVPPLHTADSRGHVKRRRRRRKMKTLSRSRFVQHAELPSQRGERSAERTSGTWLFFQGLVLPQQDAKSLWDQRPDETL